MGTKPDSNLWDPRTRVSFPRPDRRAEAKVQFEHDGVQFATAECWEVEVPGPLPVAYFVQDNIPWGEWHRISKADYELIVARCKADPTSQLIVAACNKHHLTVVFRPAGIDMSKYPTEQLFEPSEDEQNLTLIKAQILEHREPEKQATTEGPVGWDSIGAVFGEPARVSA